MKVREAMSKKPDFIPPTMNLTDASKEMLKYDFGFLPIGENDRLIGTVTDRDITIRAIAKGRDPNKTLVKDVMSDEILYCFEEDDLEHAAKNMGEEQVHRLVVLDKNKKMTGILSIGDVARTDEDNNLIGLVLKMISKKGW